MQEDSRSAYRTVNLKNAALSAAALKAVLAFMYTERLDVAIEEVDAVLRVARKCRMHAVVKAIGEEMRTLKYYFKSTRRDEAPRRFELLLILICHRSEVTLHTHTGKPTAAQRCLQSRASG